MQPRPPTTATCAGLRSTQPRHHPRDPRYARHAARRSADGSVRRAATTRRCRNPRAAPQSARLGVGRVDRHRHRRPGATTNASSPAAVPTPSSSRSSSRNAESRCTRNTLDRAAPTASRAWNPRSTSASSPIDRGVSTQHAVLRVQRLGLTITDLGSTNGTSLNDSDELLAKRRGDSSWPTATAFTSARGPRSPSTRSEDASAHDRQAIGELRDAREQSGARAARFSRRSAATSSNPGAVLDTVLEYAARLCGAAAAQLFIRDGDVFRLSRVSGETPEEYRRLLWHTRSRGTGSSTVGRAAEDKCTDQIRRRARRRRLRAAGSAAPYRFSHAAGHADDPARTRSSGCWRCGAPTSRRSMTASAQLLEEFAVQGAIVLRQVDLMRDPRVARSRAVETRSSSSRPCARWTRRSAPASTSTRCWNASSATRCG